MTVAGAERGPVLADAGLVRVAHLAREIGLDSASISREFGLSEKMVVAERDRLSFFMRRSSVLRDGALGTALRLLVLGHQVPSSEIDTPALRPLRTALEAVGSLQEIAGEDLVASALAVTPIGEHVLLSDQLAEGLPRREAWPVGPPNASTVELLSQLTPVAAHLDVGCGTGALSLLAGARQTFGFDYSGRAVAFARVNAIVNSADASFWEGDARLAPPSADGGPYELISFNAPNGYVDESFTSEFGYMATEETLRTVGRLTGMLATQGRVTARVNLHIPTTHTVEDLLGRQPFADRIVEWVALPASPLAVPEPVIWADERDGRFFACRGSSERRRRLASDLRRNGVGQVLPVVLSVAAARG